MDQPDGFLIERSFFRNVGNIEVHILSLFSNINPYVGCFRLYKCKVYCTASVKNLKIDSKYVFQYS